MAKEIDRTKNPLKTIQMIFLPIAVDDPDSMIGPRLILVLCATRLCFCRYRVIAAGGELSSQVPVMFCGR